MLNSNIQAMSRQVENWFWWEIVGRIVVEISLVDFGIDFWRKYNTVGIFLARGGGHPFPLLLTIIPPRK